MVGWSGTIGIGCLLALGLALSGTAGLAERISGDRVAELVGKAMEEAGVAAPALTAPLRGLPDCDHTPHVAPRGGNWALVELTCAAPSPWVRLVRTGTAGAMATPRGVADGSNDHRSVATTALVAARPLAKGTRISSEDLTTARVSSLAGVLRLEDTADAVGRKLRVSVGAGQQLLERHLERALDVEPGQTVMVRLSSSGFEILTTAVAVAGGEVGDRIPLQGPPGGRATEGVIIAPGLVRVRANMPRKSAVTRRNGGCHGQSHLVHQRDAAAGGDSRRCRPNPWRGGCSGRAVARAR